MWGGTYLGEARMTRTGGGGGEDARRTRGERMTTGGDVIFR